MTFRPETHLNMTSWLGTGESSDLAFLYEPSHQRKLPSLTDHQQPTNIEFLRCELLDRVDAEPFDDWSPALLRALIAVFDLNGMAPVSRPGFRPYVIK
jgi:hypothetical protein